MNVEIVNVANHAAVIAVIANNKMKTAKYFSAIWCGPCKTFKPIIKELITEGHPIEIIDIDANENLARELNIRSVPTTVIFSDDVEVERFVGAKKKEFIELKLGE